MLYDDMLSFSREIARSAGQHARDKIADVTQEMKPGNQIVTSADKECQDMIVQQIKRYWPEHGLIAEEGPGGYLLKEHPTGRSDIWWVIDPIDGTCNYAHGLPIYVVSIGIIKDGMPIVGVIYDPNTDMLFSAQLGQSAQCNGRIIYCRNDLLDSNSQIAISGKIYTYSPAAIAELMTKHICINLGSAALHLAYVAAGAFAASFLWNVRLWDIAAGAVMAASAGGVITDFTSRDRFPVDCAAYNAEPIHTFVAAPSILNQLSPIINITNAR